MGTMKIGGLASGLDTETIIETLINEKKTPITRLEDKNTVETERLNVYNELKNLTSAFQTSAYELSIFSTWAQRSATSSEEGVMTANATMGAQTGTFSVTVDNMAQAHRVKSDSLSASTAFSGKKTGDALGTSGKISLNGVEIEISATDSLENVRDNINTAMKSADSDKQVKAYLVNDTLVLERAETGATEITMEDSTGTFLKDLGILNSEGDIDEAHVTQHGQDLTGSINGVDITSSSNTLETTLANVSITVNKTGSSTITVSNNTQAIKDRLTEFMDSYNALNEYIEKQTSVKLSTSTDESSDDSKVEAVGYLQGQTLAVTLQNTVYSYMTSTFTGNDTYKNLQSLGIWTSDETNTFSLLDESKLNTALNEHFDEVQNMFRYNDTADTASNGIAKKLDTYLKNMTNNVDGPLTLRIQNLETDISDRENRISDMYTRLESYETALWLHYSKTETAVSSIQSSIQYLLSNLGIKTSSDE